MFSCYIISVSGDMILANIQHFIPTMTSIKESSVENRYQKLSHPLMNRGSKTTDELCMDYYNLLISSNSTEDKEQAYIWLLLAKLSVKKIEIPQYQNIATKFPQLIKYIQFLKWLGDVYDFTKSLDGQKSEETAYEFFRKCDFNGFLDHIKTEERYWKSLTFGGAFSNKYFGQWKQAVASIKASDKLPKKEISLYQSLAGNKKYLSKHSHNFFDKLFIEIYCLLCDAMSNEPFKVNFKLPKPQNNFESMALSVLNHGHSSLLANGNPLVMRVHVSAVFYDPDYDIINQYIDILISEKLLGLVIFYCSYIGQNEAIEIISNVLSGLEAPDPAPLRIARKYNIPPLKIVQAIIDTITDSDISDFNADIDINELVNRKIAAIGWLDLVPEGKDLEQDKVRKLLQKLVIDNQFDGAMRIFSKFGSIFTDKKENLCWNLIFDAETSFNKWKEDAADLNTVKTNLLAVLRYPSGWMINCHKVDISVGKHCIPLVASQLFDIYMKAQLYDQALGIAAMISDSGKLLTTFFDQNASRKFVCMIKRAAVANYRINQ